VIDVELAKEDDGLIFRNCDWEGAEETTVIGVELAREDYSLILRNCDWDGAEETT
jgi:hypothetical protein